MKKLTAFTVIAFFVICTAGFASSLRWTQFPLTTTGSTLCFISTGGFELSDFNKTTIDCKGKKKRQRRSTGRHVLLEDLLKVQLCRS